MSRENVNTHTHTHTHTYTHIEDSRAGKVPPAALAERGTDVRFQIFT